MKLFNRLRGHRAEAVLGMNRRNLAFILPRNPRHLFPVADDKLRAKAVLTAAGVPMPETLALFERFDQLSGVEATLARFDECVIKPANGSGGRGILVLGRGADGALRTARGREMTGDALRRHVGDIIFGVYTLDHPDVAIVERRLHPHPFFERLYPNALSDIRIIVVDGVPVLAMIRVPTNASDGKANLHQGGIGLGLDLPTGRVTRAWLKGRPVDAHPDTDAPLVDAQVPGWPAVLDCARRVGAAVDLRFLGVDLVLSRAGDPMVLEINVRPGLEIQNVTGVPLRAHLATLGIAEG
ncbi:MAG: hypothetical protein KC620_03315 [Myxococcales bacterium]|nr:hypothetical protein [Myxococcales bacterium]